MEEKVIEYVNSKNAGKTTFCQMLFEIIDQKQFTDVEVYKRANLDRRYFSKLRSDINYKPKKKIVCALALALELDNATCKKLVKKGSNKAVRIEMTENEVALEVHVLVDYGIKIQPVAAELQEAVKRNIETMTDLSVTKVDIFVDGISKESKKADAAAPVAE